MRQCFVNTTIIVRAVLFCGHNYMLLETTSTLLGRRYRLEDRLGAGGMGAVYRAFDRLTGEWIALKRVLTADENIVFSSSHRSIDLRLALAQEFQWLASLRH